MAKRRAKWNDAVEVAFEATASDFVVPLNFVPVKWSVNGVFEAPETTGSGWFAPASVADDENLYVQAAKAKLAEIEAKKSPVPAKSGPPELILDEPQRAASEPKTRVGWADEIAHEVAQEERQRENERLLAVAQKLEQRPELMIDLCEAFLNDSGGFNRQARKLFGADPPYPHIGKLMSLFAIDCLSLAGAPASLGREYEGFELRYLLRLAKLGGWGGLKD